MKYFIFFVLSISFFSSCKKNDNPVPPYSTESFKITSLQIDNKNGIGKLYNISAQPIVLASFSAPVYEASASSNIVLKDNSNNIIAATYSFLKGDSVISIQPTISLKYLTSYTVQVLPGLLSGEQTTLDTTVTVQLITAIDSTDKFAQISDSALLDLVQTQTLKYFTDFAHPVSGMARERNSSGDVVTTGGTGFGVMSIISGVNRNFISRTDGLNLITKIVEFLKNNCTRYHGAFSHWINGATGETVPFSQYDDGGDLVETSYLMQGLLCARQYFSSADASETSLRNDINTLWNGVEWSWYRQGGQNALFWHWSPNYGFKINQQISGWDEALIVYALAASSNTDSIPKIVYDNGWALNGGIKNGNVFYGYTLPLGPDLGGPLFFAHYSFLGINPNSLSDTYADYTIQNVNHSKINYSYCVANPHGYNGYSNLCWGLTASDEQKGYSAHSPDNDNGTISPTAAISSLPYTPVESMNALKFFYYKLGDKLWKEYGFVDAFNLSDLWFANSFLAIDQGPEIVMIENYRSNLLWNLFMSCPEIKRGMKQIGFQSPFL